MQPTIPASESRPWFAHYHAATPRDVDSSRYDSVMDYIDQCLKKYGDSPAFENMGKSISFGELDKKSRHFAAYLQSIGVDKPIHIGETGWATASNGFYGQNGSRATDEYKQKLYYDKMKEWTDENNISCFFFEAFDERWKDKNNPGGSENHFGLFTIDGKAKFVIWDEFDKGVFDQLSRDGQKVVKTQQGSEETLMEQVFLPE